MMTLGIDVAKKSHNATLLDQAGNMVFGNFTFVSNRQGFERFIHQVNEHHATPDCVRIGMEATGNYWTILYHTLKEKGYDVCVINPIITSARRNIGVRGNKTDSEDSKLIATILRESNPRESSIPNELTKQLRDLTRMRYECAQAIVSEKQRLLALLDLTFPEYSLLFSDVFGVASREILSQFPTANMLARVNITRLTSLLKKASRGRLGKKDAQRMKQAARTSFALKGELDGLALEIKFIVQRINLALEQVKQLDERLKDHMKDKQALLKSIPGIGDVWAPTILAEIVPFFHPEEKNGAKKLVAAAGIDVKKNDSGNMEGRGRMSKRGSKYLRTAVLQSAMIAVYTSKDPLFLSVYDRQRKRGKSHMVALSHVGNKLLHVIFSVLKNERNYKPILSK
jgi:transposase